MAFKTENRKISNIFEGQKIYTVPRYQRNYIWDKNNWSELLEDIEFTLGQENKMQWSHFLGAIVLSFKGSNFGIEEYEIIDGQQRITTIFILFLAIISKLKEGKELEQASYIYDTYIKVRKFNGAIGFKFENPELDEDIRYIYQAISDDENIEGKTKIIQLFIFFKEKLEKYTPEDIKNFLQKLLFINIVEIISEEDEEIYNIFEVLNARGQKLKQIELLKNRVMKYITPKDSDVIDKAKEKWRKVENNLNITNDIDTPLHHFTKCYIKKKAENKDSVYKLIKNEIRIVNIGKLLDDLLEFSQSYKDILKDDTNIYVKYFNIKRNQQIRTLITALHIKLYKNYALYDKYNETLRELRNIFFIFNLTKQTSNKTDKLITNFSYRIYNTETLNELKIVITELLLKLNEMISYNNIEQYLITNQTLKYSNKKDSTYSRNSSLIKYVLGEIYRKNNRDTYINLDNMTIEHLKSDTGSDETSQISNLTLITRELNESLGNKPIIEKITILKDNSNIVENQELEQFVKNGEFSFEDRLKWFALKISTEVFKVNTNIFNINKNEVERFNELNELLKNDNVLSALLKQTGTEFEKRIKNDPKMSELKNRLIKMIGE